MIDYFRSTLVLQQHQNNENTPFLQSHKQDVGSSVIWITTSLRDPKIQTLALQFKIYQKKFSFRKP